MLKAKINVKIINCNVEMQKIQEDLESSSSSLIGFDVPCDDEEYFYDEDDDYDDEDEDIEQTTKIPIGFGG